MMASDTMRSPPWCGILQTMAALDQCMDCLDFLCETCSSAHPRTRFTRNHVVAPIADLVAGKKEGERKKRYRMPCASHPDKLVVVYCLPCDQVSSS